MTSTKQLPVGFLIANCWNVHTSNGGLRIAVVGHTRYCAASCLRITMDHSRPHKTMLCSNEFDQDFCECNVFVCVNIEYCASRSLKTVNRNS